MGCGCSAEEAPQSGQAVADISAELQEEAAAVETDVKQAEADKSKELGEEVQDGLRFLQVFDPQKTGFLPRETIATIVQLCSSLSEEEVQERMNDLPSNSCFPTCDLGQGLEYHHIIPFIELEATYDLEDPKHLAKYLLDAGVRLVRAPYLYKLLSANRCMPRHQEAEHDCCEVNGMEVSALVSHEEVADWALGRRKALICSVSHAWETREHPDPCNYQLENLVNCVSLWDAAYVDDIWVFYDYLSLFQFQRDTAEQEASFRRAMSNMHVMYAHQSTLTFRLERLTPAETWTARKEDSKYKVPIYHLPSSAIAWIPLSELMENFALYLERGWCRAEIEWSAARGIQAQNIAIDGEPGKHVTVKIVPTAPEVFEERMATSAFTHRNDASTVVELQRKIFVQKFAGRRYLALQEVPPADMAELAASLPHFRNLKELNIDRFEAGEAEAKAFFKALGSVRLQKLSIRKNYKELTSGQAMIEALQEFHVAAFASMTEFAFFGDRNDSILWHDTRLPEVIAEVLKTNRTLTKIDLSGNHISGEGVQVIAEVLKSNRTLTHINLSDNLGIRDLGAQAIAEVLKTNRTLTWILLRNADIRDVGKQAIADALSHNNSVIHIDLNRDIERYQDEDTGERADAFPGHPRIQDLANKLRKGGAMTEISLRGFGDDEVKVLAEALEVNRSVSSMDLAGAEITDTGVKAIAQMLMRNKTIREINLEHKIGDSGVEVLSKALQINKGISHIDLRRNNIGDAGAQALAEMLKVNRSITHIDLGRYNQIKDAGAQALAEALKVNRSITHIDLRENQIEDAGAQALAEALKVNRSITHIDLCDNQIGQVGVEALAEAVQENDAILKIDLDGNPWQNPIDVWFPVSATEPSDDDGPGRQAMRRIEERCKANREAAKARCAAIKIQKLVQELKTDGAKKEINLQSQDIGDAQVQVLAEALKMNKSITHINLGSNNIGDAGAQALAEALKVNRSITHIDICENKIGQVGVEALAEAVQENDAILEIDLGGNPLADFRRTPDAARQAWRRIWERCKANRAAKATAAVEKLVQELKTDGAKKEINLQSQDIGDAQVQVLAEALKMNESITHINLRSNNIGDAGAQALADVLKVNRSITHTDLFDNQIGEVGAEALAEAAQENDAILEINLNENPLGSTENPLKKTDAGRQAWCRIWERCKAAKATAAVEKLVQELKTDGAKKEINLQSQDIGDAQVQVLAEALKMNESITHINLRLNNIGDAGAQALAEALKVNRSITHIDLFRNEIGQVGAEALAEAAQENDAILEINLNENLLGYTDAGCQVWERIEERCKANRAAAEAAKATAAVEKLVQELKTDGAKKEIYLEDHYIGDAQVQVLAEALKMNESITHINLRFNNIGDAGAQALAEALKVNRSITHIDLSSNQIVEVGAEALAEAVQENDAILEIDLGYNPLDDTDALERINERCEANVAATEARAQSVG